ncbi:unnamed protein product [Darwinula stevensoni]|uniref:Methyltransferase FkbM domain-containing protein n=1 Tax=Darwinula stevensoni TaxID=69355 RepID=A0A7R9AEW7_9CRUS|nr:unnamed protein product [Darwinula stevensoni]CAG0901790.1 unnamed protein product [Darwinula stevensoni]
MHSFCFPLESFLRAVGQSKVDYFSLDIGGLDYSVLSIIPWDILDIQVLMVKTNKGTRNEILKLMADMTRKWDDEELYLRVWEKGERISGNDPRLLQYIRDQVLIPPLSRDVPYKLADPRKQHFSQSQEQIIFLNESFGDSKGGFFIEAGAYDGETFSNTLWLERERNWTGLLIEPDSANFDTLMGKQRKSWLAHSCLSPVPYPQMMTLFGGKAVGEMIPGKQGNNEERNLVCFPLESLLVAIGQHNVDFFSLDIEGLDYDVLSNIPWDILNIQLLMVETNKGTREEILDFMADKKYRHVKKIYVDDIFEKSYQ